MFKQKARTQESSALCERLDSIEALVPELRNYALSLTQDPSRADRLVEDCTVRAVERLGRDADKSDLREWLFAALRKAHRSGISRSLYQSGTDSNPCSSHERTPALTEKEPRISQTELNSFSHAFSRLASDEQDLLLRIAVEGSSYDDVATDLGVSDGDIRTRVSQVRRKLKESCLRGVI